MDIRRLPQRIRCVCLEDEDLGRRCKRVEVPLEVGFLLIGQEECRHPVVDGFDGGIGRASDHAVAAAPLSGVFPDASGREEVTVGWGESVSALLAGGS